MLDLDAFMTDGFAKIDKAAPRRVADDARALLWRQLGGVTMTPRPLVRSGVVGVRSDGRPPLWRTRPKPCAGRCARRGLRQRRLVPRGSCPHTVLALTLLSDVGPDDAPTRIRAGSHHDVAGILGPDPVELVEMGPLVDEASADRPVVHAIGEPGDIYVVHPFTVHAADEHRGTAPRFMAQAPIVLTDPLTPASSSPLARVWENR